MRKYNSKAGSPVRVEYGIDLAEGLRSFPETEPLAEGFEGLNNELDEAYETRRRLRKPMLRARAVLRNKAYKADKTLRQFGRAVEIADGGRKGPLYGELIPRGLAVLVAPGGRKQHKPMVELMDRLTRSRKAGVEPLRTEWLPKIQAAATALETAIGAYDAAFKAVLDAFKNEMDLRRDHELSVDKLMGEVRALFPRDRETQDAIFPEITGRATAGDVEEPETLAEGDAPGTDPTAPV
jgi:hypothetical protein